MAPRMGRPPGVFLGTCTPASTRPPQPNKLLQLHQVSVSMSPFILLHHHTPMHLKLPGKLPGLDKNAMPPWENYARAGQKKIK